MKILITGGAGFIGGHLTQFFVQCNHEVTVFDDLSTGLIENLSLTYPQLKFVNSTVLSESVLRKEIQQVEFVIHLAAAVGVSKIMSSPLDGLITNVLGSEAVLRACSDFRIPVLITSSSEIYGKNTESPLNENSERVIGVPQISRWSYSNAKAIEESFALAYHKEKGLDVRIVRLFNTVGPRQRAEFGMVLPNMIKSAINSEPILVHGTGSQTRCFMHVKDAIEALSLVVFNSETSGKTYNVGNPVETTILQLAQRVKEITNSGSQIQFVKHASVYGDEFEDMHRRVPDITRIKQDLGWSPKIGLDEIIIDCYASQT